MNTLDEKTLTPNEVDKKEEIVKSLKKKKADFVKRYGADRAKGVMYATATKVAKAVTEEAEEAEEAEELDEAEAQKLMSNAMDNIDPAHRDAARVTYKKARSVGQSHAAALNTMFNRHMKNEEVLEAVDKPVAHKVGDTVYAATNNKAVTLTGQVTKVGRTLTTVKHKDGSSANYLHKDVSNEFEDLHPNPYKKIQREHLEQTGELLTLNQIKESDSAIDGSAKGPISRASAKHGRIKPMSGTKTIATKIATILAKKV